MCVCDYDDVCESDGVWSVVVIVMGCVCDMVTFVAVCDCDDLSGVV